MHLIFHRLVPEHMQEQINPGRDFLALEINVIITRLVLLTKLV